jgi:hypothetical protein
MYLFMAFVSDAFVPDRRYMSRSGYNTINQMEHWFEHRTSETAALLRSIQSMRAGHRPALRSPGFPEHDRSWLRPARLGGHCLCIEQVARRSRSSAGADLSRGVDRAIDPDQRQACRTGHGDPGNVGDDVQAGHRGRARGGVGVGEPVAGSLRNRYSRGSTT